MKNFAEVCSIPAVSALDEEMKGTNDDAIAHCVRRVKDRDRNQALLYAPQVSNG